MRIRKNLDLPLIAITYIIALLGACVLFSASHGDPGSPHRKQMIWIAIGTVAMTAMASMDYHLLIRFQRHFYVINIVLLGFVLQRRFHNSVNGAARWIKIGSFLFQPSEFAKLFVIITLAAYLAAHEDSAGTVKRLLKSFGYVLAPMALIFKQPDLGTALVILAIWGSMVFMAGARARHMAALAMVGAALFAGVWHSGKILKDYQKNRLIAFIHPESDPRETGYHVLQARIAIGSGGVTGKGWLRSTQVRGGYIPEKTTDFIFTDIGEEWGFVGSIAFIALYSALLYRTMLIVAAAHEDIVGKLVGTGIAAMIAFHVGVNIGMNVGILPVAGVPLPLISAGGSNVLLTFTSVGLLESIARYRHQLLF